MKMMQNKKVRQFWHKVMQRVRVLPLLVLVAILSFSVRIGDFVSGLEYMGSARAQQDMQPQEVDREAPPMPMEMVQADIPDEGADEAASEVEAERVDLPDADAADISEWRDAGQTQFDLSSIPEDLYKDLVDRRQELDQRQKELAVREALLEAAERELEQKIKEMTDLRNEIESLLEEQSEEEKARITSLVKIYEGMKAKDAAAIFNTLEMDVLIRIMAEMSERKSAPILAEMAPDRARSVTLLLAEQKKLPSHLTR